MTRTLKKPFGSIRIDYLAAGVKEFFVPIGSLCMISSDSGKWWNWGLVRAPVEEPTMFTHGFGDDAIAIPFDAQGRVAFAPVYIYTIRPENYERQRLAALFEGLSTKANVRSLFGRRTIQTRIRGYEVWYYQIGVYNPFEDYSDGRGH
jgi:hypothetical protein